MNEINHETTKMGFKIGFAFPVILFFQYQPHRRVVVRSNIQVYKLNWRQDTRAKIMNG